MHRTIVSTGKELKKLIIETFADEAFPAWEVLAGHDCEECTAVREAFRGQSPFSLQPSVLKQRFDSLPLLSPAAFHHFLPAYLLSAIDDPEDELAQFLLYSLAPNRKDEFWVERFRLFSPAESGVILAVVEYLASYDPEGWNLKDFERARRNWGAC